MCTYTGSKEGDTVSMVLSLGNVSHLLHWSTVGEDVPLTPEPLVTEEVEEPLWRDGKPHRGGGTEDDPRRFTGVIHALPRHHPHVLPHVSCVQLVPLVHCGGTHTSTEVVRHALCQLQHASPST